MTRWAVAWRLGALLAGLLCIACEVWGTYDFLLSSEGGHTYLVFAGCVVTASTGILPVFADREWGQGRWLTSIVIWLVLPLALLFIFTVSVQRTGGAADRAQGARQEAAKAAAQAKANLDDLLSQRSRKQALEKTECVQTKYGFTAECKQIRKDLDALEGRISLARQKYAAAPTEQHDPMAERLSALLAGHITPEQVRLYQPLFLPVILGIFGALFIAVGARAEKHMPTVANMRTEVPTQSAPAGNATTKETLVVATPEKSNVVVMPTKRTKTGSVSEFLLARVEPEHGSQLPLVALIVAYRKWCEGTKASPLEPDAFLKEFAEIARKAGISIAGEGGSTYCAHVKLTA